MEGKTKGVSGLRISYELSSPQQVCTSVIMGVVNIPLSESETLTSTPTTLRRERSDCTVVTRLGPKSCGTVTQCKVWETDVVSQRLRLRGETERLNLFVRRTLSVH